MASAFLAAPSLAPPKGHLTLWALSQRSPHCRDTCMAALNCASYWTPKIMSWLMSLMTLTQGRVSGPEGDGCQEHQHPGAHVGSWNAACSYIPASQLRPGGGVGFIAVQTAVEQSCWGDRAPHQGLGKSPCSEMVHVPTWKLTFCLNSPTPGAVQRVGWGG